MNNFHSNYEWIYRKRWISHQVRSAINTFPVVVISGARQVCKSTFLLNEFPDFKYVSLDNFSILEQAKIDPLSLWADKHKIVIDDAQKVPETFSAIKLSVDREKKRYC